eukprot:gene4988-9271_t
MAGVKQMYVAVETISSAAEVETLSEILAEYRRLNKTVSPKLTEKVIAACIEHNLPSLAATMVMDKVKYGMFPAVSDYNELMTSILADPTEDPAQVVHLFETLILERGDEDPDDAIMDKTIDACVRKGEPGYALAAGELMVGVVMNESAGQISLSAARHAAVAEALLQPGVASDDSAETAVRVLQGHEGGPAALSADGKGHLAAFVANTASTAVSGGFAGFSDAFKAEAEAESARISAEAAKAEAVAAAAAAAAEEGEGHDEEDDKDDAGESK